jgi:serine/threonine protein kinase
MERIDTVTAGQLAGLCPERAVWRFFADMVKGGAPAPLDPDCVRMDPSGHFRQEGKGKDPRFLAPSSSDGAIWSLGAIAYYLLMGTPVFGGRGHDLQKASTVIPSIPPRRCSRELDGLIRRCLEYDLGKRPSLEEIAEAASRERTFRKARKSMFGHTVSDHSFWKEEMV